MQVFSAGGDIIGAEGGEADHQRVRPVELPRLARPKGCSSVCDIRGICEQSGRTTGRLDVYSNLALSESARSASRQLAHDPNVAYGATLLRAG